MDHVRAVEWIRINFLRIGIQEVKWMRIHADPDPQPWIMSTIVAYYLYFTQEAIAE